MRPLHVQCVLLSAGLFFASPKVKPFMVTRKILIVLVMSLARCRVIRHWCVVCCRVCWGKQGVDLYGMLNVVGCVVGAGGRSLWHVECCRVCCGSKG